MDHINDIVEMVFQYIDLMREKKTQKWIFDESAQLRKTKFDFKDKENPQGYVSRISCKSSFFLDQFTILNIQRFLTGCVKEMTRD